MLSMTVSRSFSGGVAIRYVFSVSNDVMFAHNGSYVDMSIPLQRVTSLRRRAQASGLLRRTGCVVF